MLCCAVLAYHLPWRLGDVLHGLLKDLLGIAKSSTDPRVCTLQDHLDRLYEGAKAIDLDIGGYHRSQPFNSLQQGSAAVGAVGTPAATAAAAATTLVSAVVCCVPSSQRAALPSAGLSKQQLAELVYRTVDANGMQDGVHIRLMVGAASA